MAASPPEARPPETAPGWTASVLLYGINYAPELIGVGRYTGELGAHLASAGHRLEVVTAPPHYPGWSVRAPFRNAYTTEVSGATRITRCPLVLRRDMRGIWRMLAPMTFALSSAPVVVWRILTRRPGTVVVVEPTLLAAPAAILAARLVGARTVLHVQDLEIDAAFSVGHLKNRLLRSAAAAFERLVLKGFDTVVTISERMKERLGSKGVEGRKLVLQRNWVDLARLRPLERPRLFRTELGLGDGDFVVLYAGNVGAKQALDLVLDAAATLLDEPEIVFVIAGDGPEKPALQQRGLANVRFLPLQPEERLCELLNLADLHVLPQHAGAADLVLPSKLGGMLASGRPILATADSGTELHTFLRGAATLVAAGDTEALARAIREQHASRTQGNRDRRLELARSLSATTALERFTDLLVRSTQAETLG